MPVRPKPVKRRGARVVIETCPHYLFFTDGDLDRAGPYAKCDPPLRNREQQAGLWRCVSEGMVDYIGSTTRPTR
ncbi:MAG: hypothetical protein AB1576_08695 [Bacillota bacterium]